MLNLPIYNTKGGFYPLINLILVMLDNIYIFISCSPAYILTDIHNIYQTYQLRVYTKLKKATLDWRIILSQTLACLPNAQFLCSNTQIFGIIKYRRHIQSKQYFS